MTNVQTHLFVSHFVKEYKNSYFPLAPIFTPKTKKKLTNWTGRTMVKILILKNLVVDYTWLSDLGPVVRKPINADPRLKVNAGFISLVENAFKS